MQITKIGYLTHTWNPIAMRCTPVSAGCAKCWHLRVAKRMAYNPLLSFRRGEAYHNGKPLLLQKELDAPLHLRKPARIGVQFMGDLFHEAVPDEFIRKIWRVMQGEGNRHTYLVLTKRPKRMKEFLEKEVEVPWGGYVYGKSWLPKNIQLGVSVEDQATADERIPLLLQTPAAVRFVSYEPALGPVDFGSYLEPKWYAGEEMEQNTIPRTKCRPARLRPRLEWIIMGGETGPGARPLQPDCARSVRDQCKEASVPFFFKGWGEYVPGELMNDGRPEPWRIWQNSKKESWLFNDNRENIEFLRAGKTRTGHLLDGKEYKEMPK